MYRKDLQRLPLGTRTPLTVGLEAICVALLQEICLHFVHVLRLYRRRRLKIVDNYLEEESSRQLKIHTVASALLVAFTKVYSEDQRQKVKAKDAKSLQLHQKGSTVPANLGSRGVWLVKRLPLKRSQVICIRMLGAMP